MRKIKKNIKRNNKKNSTARIKRRARKKLYIVNNDYDLCEYMMEQGYIVSPVASIDDVPLGAKYTYGSSIFIKTTKCVSDTFKPKRKKAKKIETIYVTSNVDTESRALYEAQGYFVEEIDLAFETMPRGAVCDWGYGLTTN